MTYPETLPLPRLEDRYDRIVANLTRRLAETAQAHRAEPASDHDFLVPLLRPDLLEVSDRSG
jgi:hypothetical protein